MFKIQSISDIITNSSTEVFMVYSKESINSMKELVNALLEFGESKYSFDDLFEVLPEYVDEGELRAQYEEDGGEATGLSFEDYVIENNYNKLSDGEGYPNIIGIKVIPKKHMAKGAAKLIESIPNIFEYKDVYC